MDNNENAICKLYLRGAVDVGTKPAKQICICFQDKTNRTYRTHYKFSLKQFALALCDSLTKIDLQILIKQVTTGLITANIHSKYNALSCCGINVLNKGIMTICNNKLELTKPKIERVLTTLYNALTMHFRFSHIVYSNRLGHKSYTL